MKLFVSQMHAKTVKEKTKTLSLRTGQIIGVTAIIYMCIECMLFYSESKSVFNLVHGASQLYIVFAFVPNSMEGNISMNLCFANKCH